MKTNYLLTFSLFFSILFYLNDLKAQCHLDDWTALKALYENAGGDNWTNNDNWSAVTNSSPPANCNLENLHGIDLNGLGRVEQINLSENNLSGTIPVEIGNLIYLKRLFFDNAGAGGTNQLTGNIPAEIGNLTQLESLYLSYNQLTGEIPASIGNLINLKKLIVQLNQLSGELPTSIGNLSNLTHLFVYKNQLTGNISPGICNLNSLTILRLASNQFEGSIPACIGDIGNSLQILNFTSNKLSGNIPSSIGNLNGLKDLYLSANNFTGSLPAEIGNLSNLENLGIGSTYLEGSIPTSFGNLTSLKKLWLTNNFLSGGIPTQLTNLPQLIKLDLRLNKLTGTIPQFSNPLLKLHVQQNYFTCTQIQTNFTPNQQLATFEYEPQFKTPSNYNTIQSHVINTADIGQVALTLSPNFSGINGHSYQWRRNNKIINGANNANLNLQNIQGSNAGKYTLHFQNQNCGLDVEFVSDPIYVVVEGYDIYGYSVNTKQVMVEFDNPDRTTFFKNEVLLPNGGIVKKECNCNRELYLWEFSTTEDAVEALVAIDKKLLYIKKKAEADGGFNNNIKLVQVQLILF